MSQPLTSLPKGCVYKESNDGYYVTCDNISASTTPQPLPANCSQETTANEYVIRCDTSEGVPTININSTYGASPSPLPTSF
jgi:hypothetical protein